MNITENTRQIINHAKTEIQKSEKKLSIYKGVYWGLAISTILISIYLPLVFTLTTVTAFIIYTRYAWNTRSHINSIILQYFHDLKNDPIIYEKEVPTIIKQKLFRIGIFPTKCNFCELFIILEKGTNKNTRYIAYSAISSYLDEYFISEQTTN